MQDNCQTSFNVPEESMNVKAPIGFPLIEPKIKGQGVVLRKGEVITEASLGEKDNGLHA